MANFGDIQTNITLTGGQSVRRNVGDTDFEAFTPGSGGSGDVSKVGTPVDNQVGVWTGDGTIEGDVDLTFDTTTNILGVGLAGLDGRVQVHAVKSDASDGLLIEASNGTDVGLLGVGNTANATWYGSHNFDTATQDTIAAFTGAGKTLGSLATATYPSLTELSYVKGVTSAIQTQINAKGDALTSGALTQFVGNGNYKVFYSDGSGDVQELALGASGTVLQSNGASSAPTFETPTGGSGITLGQAIATTMGFNRL
jgi:hypothetical protein